MNILYKLLQTFYIKIKETMAYIKFICSFNKSYKSEYNINDMSECIFRQTYYNEKNKTLVELCKQQNAVKIKTCYNEMDSDKIYSDEYFERRMSMRIIAKHIRHNFSKEKTILDIACGHGAIDRVLSKYGYKVTGIDLNSNRINKLKNYIYKTECIAIENMDISLKYDIIISLEMLEHVPNILLVLKKMFELLNSGGICYISVPNKQMIDDEQHLRFFNSDSLISLMSQTGFQVISVTALPYLNCEKGNDLVCVAKKI